jgi:hypothetical protein
LVNEEDLYLFGQEGSAQIRSVLLRLTNVLFSEKAMLRKDELIMELAADKAIQEADRLLLIVPNTLGVDCNVWVLSSFEVCGARIRLAGVGVLTVAV